MDFIEFKKLYRKDPDYPDRTFMLQMYKRVLDGTLYDIIPNPFYKSSSPNLGSSRTPIPLSQRRPTVRYRLSKVVVDQSISLVFGEGKFPFIETEDEYTKTMLNRICSLRHIDYVMIDCATKGSIGSVVLLVKVINGRLFFDTLCTEYLCPQFDPENPDELIKLTEKYKVYGKKLIEIGYDPDQIEENKVYWFKREWDENQEIYYIPVCCDSLNKKKIKFEIDTERTITHGLGFVPAIWIKNLPGGESPDGECTFKDAIDTNIELDYQMSQAGRGLKYSADPLLVIKNMSLSAAGPGSSKEINPGNGDVLLVDENGDAKHVEISGDACRAVLEYCKVLREIILENIHGNRATPEKSHNVQSGKALEMMNITLIWLASKLRISYGEFALVKLMEIILKISKRFDLLVGNDRISHGTLKQDTVSLKWPDWFDPTDMDKAQKANTLKTLKDASLISSRTAITSLAVDYDMLDVELELDNIATEKAEFNEQYTPKVTEIIQG